MRLNRIQIEIFKKLSSELQLETEDYLQQFSQEYIKRTVYKLEDLTEAEADAWITKAYLQSLG